MTPAALFGMTETRAGWSAHAQKVHMPLRRTEL